jgi:hypothetical protein
MSLAPNRPLTEITETALRLLIQEIGVVNTVRFINQFNMGSGDSVAEKERLFDTMTVEQIVTTMRQTRQESSATTE